MSENWSKYLATGIPVGPEEPIPVRKEIRSLTKEEKFLYLEGLARFQYLYKEDEDRAKYFKDPLSYFQIAGIHGLPYEKWPDQTWNNDIPKVDDGQFQGFCAHTSILFLTWHRPYLALFEAELHRHVNEIAEGIQAPPSEKAKYVAAAKQFRMPYWDWAQKDVAVFPREALHPSYTRDGPSSSASVLPEAKAVNPLYQFKFAKGISEDIKNGHEATVRYPGQPNAQNLLLEAIQKFYDAPSSDLPPLNPERNLTERVSYILRYYDRYGPMSNNRYHSESQDPKDWGSIEGIHNTLHNLVGGDGGHMTSVPISAFDPIFWLHHTNIDRLFAIWQALHEDVNNPETYVTEKPSNWGSFAIKVGDPENAETYLYPFRDTKTSWFTSEKAKRTEPFGYAYPETKGLHYPTSGSEKEALIQLINEFYTDLSFHIRKSQKKIENAGEELLPQAWVLGTLTDKNVTANTREMMTLVSDIPTRQTLLQNSLKPSKPFLRDLAPENKYLEWLVNVKAEKHSLDGAYTVHTFLGPVEKEQVYLWPISPNHVGTFAPLGQRQNTGCEKCRKDRNERVQVTGQIPLTIALAERYLAGLLDDLSEENVIPFLKKHLHWKVAKNDGTIIDNYSEVEGLTIYVISREVTVPENDYELPASAPSVKIHPDVSTNLGNISRSGGTGLIHDDQHS